MINEQMLELILLRDHLSSLTPEVLSDGEYYTPWSDNIYDVNKMIKRMHELEDRFLEEYTIN